MMAAAEMDRFSNPPWSEILFRTQAPAWLERRSRRKQFVPETRKSACFSLAGFLFPACYFPSAIFMSFTI
jgi:hypothetical protein